MSKKQKNPQWKKIHKQQQEILEQMEEIKKDVSTLIRTMDRIEAQMETIGNRFQRKERKKNRLFSFPRKRLEKKETASNPLSALGAGDFNLVQVMEILQNPAMQKMLQKFLS